MAIAMSFFTLIWFELALFGLKRLDWHLDMA
jgi:hypothetical protein